MYIETLQKTGDFLSLTRANEWFLAPAEFELKDGTSVSVLDTGVIVFDPVNPGTKDIVLSSAIHGNETAPIEICDALIKHIITGKLTLSHRVMFIFGNPASINIEKRFVEENLNRLFSGAHSQGESVGANERDRAAKLERYVTKFFNRDGVERLHYDLHTAIRESQNEKFAVYPFLHGKPWKKEQLQFLRACGVTTVLMMKSSATTFSYFSSHQFGADSFTVELGKVHRFGENDMSRFEDAKHTLTKLISEPTLSFDDFSFEQFELFEVHRTINRTHETFTLAFSDDVKNFTQFNQGDLLATDGGEPILADSDGEAVIFPNANVAIGQRAILTVLPLSNRTNFV